MEKLEVTITEEDFNLAAAFDPSEALIFALNRLGFNDVDLSSCCWYVSIDGRKNYHFIPKSAIKYLTDRVYTFKRPCSEYLQGREHVSGETDSPYVPISLYLDPVKKFEPITFEINLTKTTPASRVNGWNSVEMGYTPGEYLSWSAHLAKLEAEGI